MYTSYSSVSYWTQTKVTALVKTNLVLVFASLLVLKTKAVVTSPVQVQWDSQGLGYCDFGTPGKQYSISDMLECINDLTSKTALKRNLREAKERSSFFPTLREGNFEKPYDYNYIRYPPYPDSVDEFYRRPNILNRGHQYQGNQPGYYGYPPALPPGYPVQSSSDIRPGILGVNLLNALSSISEYDDHKCVPRILCEVATGVIPGKSGYTQSDTGFGMNSLLSLLSSFDTGTSSPLLTFGKSALMGYANKGNPGVCYQQYPKCPRNPTDLVNYLNNHNGGFFRFFSNRNGGLHYRQRIRGNLTPSSDATEQKLNEDPAKLEYENKALPSTFQHSQELEENNRKVVFPNDHLNRVSKSLNLQNKSSFFPQSRTSQGHQINNRDEEQSLKSPEARLYLPDNLSKRNFKRLSFPDNQSDMMNVEFAKLFSDDNDANHERRSKNINLEFINSNRSNIRNLFNLLLENKYRNILRSCEMTCHDSYGFALQINQSVESDKLATLTTPDRPVFHLSQHLPCQVICQRSDSNNHQLSTTLDIVLQSKKIQEQSSKINEIENGNDQIQATVINENPVPHSDVPFLGLAGGHNSLQQREHVEQRPPVQKSEQGARVMFMGVPLFKPNLRVDENSLTVRVSRKTRSSNSPNTSIHPANSTATSGTLASKSSLTNIKGKVTSVKPNKIPKYRPPEGEDYPQGSCLESEFQDSDEHQCTPIKHNIDYSENKHIVTEPVHKAIPVRISEKKSKIVIMTPEADVYIESDY